MACVCTLTALWYSIFTPSEAGWGGQSELLDSVELGSAVDVWGVFQARPLTWSILGGLIAATAELFPVGLDDNVAVPVLSGMALTALLYLCA